MAVTTEEILAAARELAGRAMTDGEEKILSVLCAGELGAWRGRLREGVTEEDCGDALTVACAWGALAAMEVPGNMGRAGWCHFPRGISRCGKRRGRRRRRAPTPCGGRRSG